jgi:hypothetical protein
MSDHAIQLSPSISPVISHALVETVAAFLEQHEPHLAVTYQWSPKEEQLLELLGLRLVGRNGFEQNLNLKRQLSELWTSQPAKRYVIADYYVRIWGGIRRNRPGKIDGYTDSVAAGNVLPFDGVASWSKVATAADPDKAAIFDARVSVSLNALQVLAGHEAAALFPILASQNKAIKAINPLLNAGARSRRWAKVNKEEAFDAYLRLLRLASRRLAGPLPIARAEMVLFAHAVDLANQVRPELQN